jgi:hypothetical protein
LKRRSPEPLRYFIYVSDSKLEMLFEQIRPSILKRISAEIKVDLKVAGVTLQKSEERSPVRMARLRIVERYIEKYHQVGSVQDPGGEYFRGRMNMRWGRLSLWANTPVLPVVFFRGELESRTVMLAGSTRHLLGEPPEANAAAFSALPDIISALNDYLPDEVPQQFFDSREWANSRREVGDWVVNRAAMVTIYPEQMPRQELEFLAIPLHEGPIDLINSWDRTKDQHSHGILATPLYVTMARPASDMTAD